MLQLLLLLIGILFQFGYWVLYKRCRLPVSLFPLMIISWVTAVQYAASLAGFLSASAYSVIALGVLLFIYFCGEFIYKNMRGSGFVGAVRSLGHFIVDGNAVFWLWTVFVVIAMFLFVEYQLAPLSRDNYNHWLLLPKYISCAGNLPTSDNVTTYLNYVPGLAILQSFAGLFVSQTKDLFCVYAATSALLLIAVVISFLKIHWNYRTSLFILILLPTTLYILGNYPGLNDVFVNKPASLNTDILTVAIVAVFVFILRCDCIKRHISPKTAAFAAMTVLLFSSFWLVSSCGYFMVDADVPLTYWSTACIGIYFLYFQRLKYSVRFMAFALPLIFLVLIKNNASLFFVIIIAFVVIDHIQYLIFWKIFDRKRRITGKKEVVFLLTLLFVAAIATVSWRSFEKLYVARFPKGTRINFQGVNKVLTAEKIKEIVFKDQSPIITRTREDNKIGFAKTPFVGFAPSAKIKFPLKDAIPVLIVCSIFFLAVYPTRRRVAAMVLCINGVFWIGLASLLVGILCIWRGSISLNAMWIHRYIIHFAYSPFLLLGVFGAYGARCGRMKYLRYLPALLPVVMILFINVCRVPAGSNAIRWKREIQLSRAEYKRIVWCNKLNEAIREAIGGDAANYSVAVFTHNKFSKWYPLILRYSSISGLGRGEIDYWPLPSWPRAIPRLANNGKYKYDYILLDPLCPDISQHFYQFVNNRGRQIMIVNASENGVGHLFRIKREKGKLLLRALPIKIPPADF